MKTKNIMKTAFTVFSAMLMLAGAITIIPENDAASTEYLEFDSDTGTIDAPGILTDKYSVNGNELTLYDGLKATCIRISGSNAVLIIEGAVTISNDSISLRNGCNDLTITGTGVLTIDNRVECRNGNLTITSGVTVIFNASYVYIWGTLTVSNATVYANHICFGTLNADRMTITGVDAYGTRTELTENNIGAHEGRWYTFYLNEIIAYNVSMTPIDINYEDNDDNWYYNQYLDRNGTIYDTSSSSDDDTTVIAAVAAAVAALAVICIAAIAIRRN